MNNDVYYFIDETGLPNSSCEDGNEISGIGCFYIEKNNYLPAKIKFNEFFLEITKKYNIEELHFCKIKNHKNKKIILNKLIRLLKAESNNFNFRIHIALIDKLEYKKRLLHDNQTGKWVQEQIDDPIIYMMNYYVKQYIHRRIEREVIKSAFIVVDEGIKLSYKPDKHFKDKLKKNLKSVSKTAIDSKLCIFIQIIDLILGIVKEYYLYIDERKSKNLPKSKFKQKDIIVWFSELKHLIDNFSDRKNYVIVPNKKLNESHPKPRHSRY